MYVHEQMTPDPETVTPETKQDDAWKMIVEGHFRQLPVVKNGKLVGVLSRTDLLRDMVPVDHDKVEAMFGHPVKSAMTPDPITTTADTRLEKAAETMYQSRVGCLPVVNNDEEITGILTRTDLFRAIVEMIGMGDESARLQIETNTFDDLFEKAGKLSDQMNPLSILMYLDGERGLYKGLFRFGEDTDPSEVLQT